MLRSWIFYNHLFQQMDMDGYRRSNCVTTVTKKENSRNTIDIKNTKKIADRIFNQQHSMVYFFKLWLQQKIHYLLVPRENSFHKIE